MSSLAQSDATAGAPAASRKGRWGMACLILTESALFLTFVVTYLYYTGKSLSGPYPVDVIEYPTVLFNSACLISSSFTIVLAVRALARGRVALFKVFWVLTMLLGLEFLVGTAIEWKGLIEQHDLTLSSNLFGSTFYSLVGLHLAHVTLGVLVMLLITTLALFGRIRREHAERLEICSWYWHFVDAVWIVVFLTVYVYGV
jgi:cytochrome c oxidase subunit 3/cytochrome o ubiquinol oxidase subunit 3